MNFLFPYMARWKAVNWSRYHQIFTRLAEMGHHVYIIQPPSCDINETNYQEIEVDVPDNLHLIDLPLNPAIWENHLPFNKLVKKGYYSLACRKKVLELINKHKIDALFLYNIPQYLLMIKAPCLVVFDIADDYTEMLKHELGKFSNPAFLKIAEFVLVKMIKNSDLTLSISHSLADHFKVINGKIKVLPNGADSRFFNTFQNTERKYKNPVVGFIGSFEYFIDFELILNVAGMLPEITFLLVGAGRELASVKDQAIKRGLKNTVFTGAVPHGEIAGYINEMDICLNIFKKIPISHNACPIKLFEYLAMKKPVISTRLNELLKINERFIFFADTVEETVREIKRLLNDDNIAREYSERGHNITLEKYSWDKITVHLLELLKDIRK